MNIIDLLIEKNIEVHENEKLSKHTSFKIGGNAACFTVPHSYTDIKIITETAKQCRKRIIILGNGSNMLFSDDDIDAVFIYIGESLSNIEYLGGREIKAQAGALLIKVCKTARDLSLSGMEALYGIPGSVGGGLYMNAGAYGSEMKDVVKCCEYLDFDGNIQTVSTENMDLSYRSSIFHKNDGIILSVTFSLVKGEKEDINGKMNDFLQRRRDKQPLEYPSAGSAFKRPEGYYAGALIEQCGLKGKNIGDAYISEKHAGFIVNKGNATANDVNSLIELCQKTVLEQKGVMLEPEIKVFR